MVERMTSGEVRSAFIGFFRERGHEIVPSAPLIPRDDPTLLFNSAGMVPFKPYYVLTEPPCRRAASIQRCLRLSDLDEVGTTPYHATFFEMLGNFSFGDYFKRETILWGWEFLTDVLRLPPERLWVSVYTDDDAAAEIWEREIGLPPGRITRLGDEDNFWGPAGDAGPCGPCSEIYYDMGEERGCGRPECRPGCDCDRFFEVWNLVFPQYLQSPDGTRELLAHPGIDTGMGFERLLTILQGAESIFETDVLAPIVVATREASRASRADEAEIRIIADHVRALTFAIAENILPSNDAHGYVVRRILRRAALKGHRLGVEGPFLYRLAGVVTDTLEKAHPHLRQKREHVALAIKAEEERFRETLASGSAALAEIVERLASAGENVLPGSDAFRLYDTYGFPVELTREIAAESGLDVELDGFEAEMARQKERGRRASAFAESGAERRPWTTAEGRGAEPSEFTGYALAGGDPVSLEIEESAVLSEPIEATVWGVRRAAAPDLAEVVISRTPFYAEAGGQVADTGILETPGGAIVVRNVYLEGDERVHVVEAVEDTLSPGVEVRARVDLARRRRIEKNHSATHLLQAALRAALGEHVHQSGSWVGPDRLRFDFTHFAELTPDEIERVEATVNAWVRADIRVSPEEMQLDEALSRGAMALFGEKYGERVRCVSVPGISLELCGGTHVTRTGEIGTFAIVSESSVAAGVRRIEALTGRDAVERARSNSGSLRRLADEVRSSPHELEGRVRELLDAIGSLRKEVARSRREAAGSSVDSLISAATEDEGIKLAIGRVDAHDLDAMRALADELRTRLGSGAGVIAAEIEGSVTLLAVVTDDLVAAKRLRAGDVVREVAAIMGGRGGGRPHLAQAGGGDVSRLDAALEAAPGIVAGLLQP